MKYYLSAALLIVCLFSCSQPNSNLPSNAGSPANSQPNSTPQANADLKPTQQPALQVTEFIFSDNNWVNKGGYNFSPNTYISIDKNGNASIRTKVYYADNLHGNAIKDSTTYFATKIDSGLMTTINKLFIDKVYSDRLSNDSGTSYSSLHYIIAYTSPKTGKHFIFFRRNDVVTEIELLRARLEKMVMYMPMQPGVKTAAHFKILDYRNYVEDYFNKKGWTPPVPY